MTRVVTRSASEQTSRCSVLPPLLLRPLLLCSFASELASSHPSSPPDLGVAEEGRGEGGREGGKEKDESKKVRIKKLEVLQQTLGKIEQV